MKQETLEEAAEKYAEAFDNRFWVSATFKEGAKWQADKMYTEEDMQEYAKFSIVRDREGVPSIVVKEWFEQFKKKP
jgi:hypothetical protein